MKIKASNLHYIYLFTNRKQENLNITTELLRSALSGWILKFLR